MKQTKKVMRKNNKGLTKGLREKRRKRSTKKKGGVKRGGGNFLLPFWQGM